jgi:protein-S-isoprenylcysteine O-methyltransferase Ste14
VNAITPLTNGSSKGFLDCFELDNYAISYVLRCEEKMTERKSRWMDWTQVLFTSLLLISQIVVGIYLLLDVSQIQILAYAGVGLYVFSGIVFGWLPIFEFRKKGRVKTGKSYIHTTKLVETGIYSLVRHPQYITFMLWSVAGMLLFQHWIVILLGIPISPLTYVDLLKADKNAIMKFGDDYITYMKKVPRANFLLGIIRRIRAFKK